MPCCTTTTPEVIALTPHPPHSIQTWCHSYDFESQKSLILSVNLCFYYACSYNIIIFQLYLMYTMTMIFKFNLVLIRQNSFHRIDSLFAEMQTYGLHESAILNREKFLSREFSFSRFSYLHDTILLKRLSVWCDFTLIRSNY